MNFTFLGTGTSQGVPVIGCTCKVCTSSDPRDNRLRASGLLKTDSATILFDAGPDFRMQMLRSHTASVDVILLTHKHYDHVGGLDDVRGINYNTKRPLTVYCDSLTHEAVQKNLSYVFVSKPYPGVPKIDLIDHEMKPFCIGDELVEPLPIMHDQMPITGYRIGRFAYVTDASSIADTTYERLRGVEVLVINALRFRPHHSHFSVEQALGAIRRINPKRAYLTHPCHDIGLHSETQAMLPEGVYLGYDGLSFDI